MYLPTEGEPTEGEPEPEEEEEEDLSDKFDDVAETPQQEEVNKEQEEPEGKKNVRCSVFGIRYFFIFFFNTNP